ncbi:MAG: hypothetical protein BA864_13325 [Desulfuromonadales bacterium C00003093]|nr:MAG: hypothetical protein BA864_13325 [Desulfuromonadales bacterium C00003093]
MKRKVFGFLVTLVVVMFMTLGAALAQDLGLKEWSQAIRFAAQEKGFNYSLVSLDRRRLVDDVYEYTLVLKVGRGEFDKIGIHRVIREGWSRFPIRAPRGIMMIHGDTCDFRSGFLMSTQSNEVSTEHSLAIYLAQRNIDVWGIDLRWTFVPDYYPGTETPYCDVDGCTFMQNWDTGLHLKDIRTAVKVARIVRALTGSGFGKVFMLGHSRGAQFTYAYANKETQLQRWKRDLRGIIPVEMVYKFDPDETELIENACTRCQILEETYASGTYHSDEAVTLKYISYLAATAPDELSGIIPGFTNKQAALFVLSATHATYEEPMTPPVPYYHFCAGTFDEYGIPTGLQITNFGYALDFAFAVPSFQSLGEIIDGEAIWCDDSTPYDDYLDQINIPVFYVGAAGGFGEYGEYTLELLGSTDKESLIVQLYPPEPVALDYGHVDLLFADNAESLVWEPICHWINSH